MVIIVMRYIGRLCIVRRKESLTRRVFCAYHGIERYFVIKRSGSNGTPAECDGGTETCTGQFALHPPAAGSVFRCVGFEPEVSAVMATVDGRAAFAEMGAAANIVESARHQSCLVKPRIGNMYYCLCAD